MIVKLKYVLTENKMTTTTSSLDKQVTINDLLKEMPILKIYL